MLAVGLDVVFLIVVAVISVIRFFITKATESNDAEPPENRPRRTITPMRRPQGETDADRIRKFLEALGQPPGTQPPPPVRPRETPPPVPQIQPEVVRKLSDWQRKLTGPLPPLTTAPPPVPEPERPRRAIQPRKMRKPSVPLPAPIAEAQPAEGPSPAAMAVLSELSSEAYDAGPRPVTRRQRTDLTALLRTQEGLRQAVILREIFGPPRSLQPLDLVGSA